MSDPIDWTRSDLTPEEVAQVWREAPIMRVAPEVYDALERELAEDPEVKPRLAALAERVKKELGW